MKKSNNEHMHVNTTMEKRSSKKSGWKEEGGRTGRLVCAATELQARSAPPQVFVLAVAEAMHPNGGRGALQTTSRKEERKGKGHWQYAEQLYWKRMTYTSDSESSVKLPESSVARGPSSL
jgi:hypothetical protein